jgi:RNA polymerase sigma-70 factor, ECF subfamily
MHEFRHALEQLSEEHREVLLMVGVMGFSYEEAAEVCDVALGTVKSRVNRARARLAEILGLSSVEDIGPDPVNSGILNKPAKYF